MLFYNVIDYRKIFGEQNAYVRKCSYSKSHTTLYIENAKLETFAPVFEKLLQCKTFSYREILSLNEFNPLYILKLFAY